jgi:hypothetical protein
MGRDTDWRPCPTPPKRKITISGPGPNLFLPATIPDILPGILSNFTYQKRNIHLVF